MRNYISAVLVCGCIGTKGTLIGELPGAKGLGLADRGD